ncbi:VWA domain-containing protein [Natrinema sp. H-ect4]|uniref:vWA domain-containing protein n=1 Tax=Natrinema sp. H-ect4 TaxID=3242699 RepID=UPI0035A828FB
MKEDKYGLSRRQLLGGLGAIGVTSAGVGLGTTAYFSDDEMLGNNSLASGELDLLLDYKTTYHGGPGRLEDIREMGYDDATELEGEAGTYLLEEVPDTGDIDEWDEYVLNNGFCGEDAREMLVNGQEVSPIHLEDVKPGDSGCLSTSLHLCSNPGYIWMNGELVADDDNGLTEPESAVDDTGGEGDGDLADAVETRVWYDENCDCELDREGADGGEIDVVLVLDRSGSMSGSMGAMMDAANGLIDELGSNANVGLVSYSTSASLDQELTGSHGDVQSAINGLSGGGQTHIVDGVEEAQDELHNGPNARSGADKIMVVMSDGEHNQSGDPVVAADDAKSDGTELYTVGFGSADASTLQSMASNPWDVHYFDAADDDELIDAFSQIGQAIAGERVIFEGTLAELMGILETDLGIPLDGDRETEYNEVEAGAPAAGDGEGRACFEPGVTTCVSLEWELPVDVGNEVQTDSVAFDVGFYGEQCRHNDGAGSTAD